MIFGQQTWTFNSGKDVLTFSQEEQVIGFFGTEKNRIESIGALVLKSGCAISVNMSENELSIDDSEPSSQIS